MITLKLTMPGQVAKLAIEHADVLGIGAAYDLPVTDKTVVTFYFDTQEQREFEERAMRYFVAGLKKGYRAGTRG